MPGHGDGPMGCRVSAQLCQRQQCRQTPSAGTHIEFDGVFCDWLLWDKLGRKRHAWRGHWRREGSARGGHLTPFPIHGAPATLRCRRRRGAWATMVGGSVSLHPTLSSLTLVHVPLYLDLNWPISGSSRCLGVWEQDGCGVRLQRWCGVVGPVVLQSFPTSKDVVDGSDTTGWVQCSKPGAGAH